MEQTITLDAVPMTDAECEAAIDRLLAEMTQVRRQMADDQRDIERLQAETRVLLSRLKTA